MLLSQSSITLTCPIRAMFLLGYHLVKTRLHRCFHKGLVKCLCLFGVSICSYVRSLGYKHLKVRFTTQLARLVSCSKISSNDWGYHLLAIVTLKMAF